MAIRRGGVHFDNTASNGLAFSDNATFAPPSNRLRVFGKINPANIALGESMTFIGQYNLSSQRGWKFGLNTGGGLQFRYSPNGNNPTTQINSSAALSTVVSNGDDVWVMFDLDLDNGASDADGTFYWSTDATTDFASVSWTQLGTVQNPGAVVSIHNSTGDWYVGDTDSGGEEWFGKLEVVGTEFDDTINFNLPLHDESIYAADKSTLVEPISGLTGTFEGDSWTFVPTWNPDNFPVLATAEAFWFAGDGNGAYGPSSVNPWADLSGNNHHFTQNGDPTHAAASGSTPANWDVDGTGDYFTAPDDADLDVALADSFTVLAWVAADTNTGSDFVVGKKDNVVGNSAGYNLYMSSNTYRLLLGDGAGISFTNNTSPTAPAAGTFAVVVAKKTVADDDLRSFQDGTEHNNSPTTDARTASQENSVAFSAGAESDGGAIFNGQFAAVAFWRSALTDTQIANLQNELTNFRVGVGATISRVNLGLRVGF